MFGFWKRQNHHPTTANGYDPILGELGEATVVKVIAYRCPGRIRYRGSSWPAECHQRSVVLKPGMRVRVVRRHIICMIVEPDE